MANGEQNGWNEYSKLVISELERLNDGITKLNVEIQDLKGEIKELKVKEDFAKEIWKWKQAVDGLMNHRFRYSWQRQRIVLAFEVHLHPLPLRVSFQKLGLLYCRHERVW